LLFVATLGSAGRAAAAEITPTAQTRTVSGTCTFTENYWLPTSNFFFPDFDPPDFVRPHPNGPLSFTAPDFSPWGPTLYVVETGQVVDAFTKVDQDSRIDPYAIVASGGHETVLDGSAGTWSPPATPYNFNMISTSFDSSSDFSTTFTLDEATPYRLHGQLDHTPSVAFLAYVIGGASVRLSDAGGTIHEAAIGGAPCEFGCDDWSEAFDFHGVLPAGTYTLEAEANGHGESICADVGGGLTCFQPAGTGTFDVEFSIAAQVPAVGAPWAFALAFALAAIGRRTLAR
jgi:hypothetical protein